MNTTQPTKINFANYTRIERVRGFQPPWRTIRVYQCPDCKREIKIRMEQSVPGAFICDHGNPTE